VSFPTNNDPVYIKRSQHGQKILEKGEKALESMKYDQARQYFLEAYSVFSEIKNMLAAAQAYHFIGLSWEYQGDRIQALEAFYHALSLRKQANHNIEIANSEKKIARLLILDGQLELAKESAQKAIDLLEHAEEPYNLADALYLLGDVYLQERNAKSAQFYYNLALERMPNPEALYFYGNILQGQGEALQMLAQYPESNAILMKALKFAQLKKNWVAAAHIAMIMGKNWQELDDKEKSLTYFKEAQKNLDAIAHLKLHELQITLYTRYSDALFYFGDFTQAELITENAIELAEANGLNAHIVPNLLLMARINLNKPLGVGNPWGLALNYAQEAGDLAKENNNILWQIRAEIQKARIALKRSQMENAKKILSEAELMAKKPFNHQWQALGEVHKEWGLFYHAQDQNERALEYFQQSIEMFEKVNNLEELGEVHYNLACVASLEHNGELLMTHLKAAIAINRRYRRWAKEDEDFRGIKNDRLFQQLIED
jgi:tetratricopeptide (TPR) repeat protein